MKKEKFNNHPVNSSRIDAGDIPSEITAAEMEELLQRLSDYRVKLPDEEEINRTIDALKPYIPRRTNPFYKTFFPVGELKNLISVSLGYMNRWYAVLVGILYILGYFITRSNGISPYRTMLFLAPLPFILGILDAVKGREDGMLELEMSCRISARQFAAAKLLLAGVYAILLNIALSLVLAWSEPAVSPWRITILWLTPFTFISGVGLWITTRVRGYYMSAVFTVSWMLAAYAICLSPDYVQRFLNVNMTVFFILVLTGLVFLVTRIRSFYAYLSFIHEGNGYSET